MSPLKELLHRADLLHRVWSKSQFYLAVLTCKQTAEAAKNRMDHWEIMFFLPLHCTVSNVAHLDRDGVKGIVLAKQSQYTIPDNLFTSLDRKRERRLIITIPDVKINPDKLVQLNITEIDFMSVQGRWCDEFVPEPYNFMKMAEMIFRFRSTLKTLTIRNVWTNPIDKRIMEGLLKSMKPLKNQTTMIQTLGLREVGNDYNILFDVISKCPKLQRVRFVNASALFYKSGLVGVMTELERLKTVGSLEVIEVGMVPTSSDVNIQALELPMVCMNICDESISAQFLCMVKNEYLEETRLEGLVESWKPLPPTHTLWFDVMFKKDLADEDRASVRSILRYDLDIKSTRRFHGLRVSVLPMQAFDAQCIMHTYDDKVYRNKVYVYALHPAFDMHFLCKCAAIGIEQMIIV
eukprot:763838-Hanusia_phi.AAC.3